MWHFFFSASSPLISAHFFFYSTSTCGGGFGGGNDPRSPERGCTSSPLLKVLSRVPITIISQIILKNGLFAAHKQTGLVQGALDILSKYNLHTYMTCTYMYIVVSLLASFT